MNVMDAPSKHCMLEANRLSEQRGIIKLDRIQIVEF